MGQLNQQFPIYNGITPSWADFFVEITPDGGAVVDTIDIQAVNTTRSVEVGEQRGTSGGRVMARTLGAGSQEASMTLYLSGCEKLHAALVEVAPRRGNQYVLTAVHFQVHLKWTPLGSDKIFQRLIKGARVIGDTLDSSEGSDATMVEIPLSVIEIVDIDSQGREIVLI